MGVARVTGDGTRYRLFAWDGENTPHQRPGPGQPILFKPMGTPRPAALAIASDADYVDYITELMGGFAIPPTLKTLRQGKALPADGPAPEPRHRTHGDGRHHLRRPHLAGLGADCRTHRQEERFCADWAGIIRADIGELIGETAMAA